MQTPRGKWAPQQELKAKALEIWSREAIEEALGPEAETAPPVGASAELRARIGWYQVPCSSTCRAGSKHHQPRFRWGDRWCRQRAAPEPAAVPDLPPLWRGVIDRGHTFDLP
jgi:hypothetical protein